LEGGWLYLYPSTLTRGSLFPPSVLCTPFDSGAAIAQAPLPGPCTSPAYGISARARVPTRAREDRRRSGGPLQAHCPRQVADAPPAGYPQRRPLCTLRRFASLNFPRGVTRDLHRPRRFGFSAPTPTFARPARLRSSFLPQRLDALLHVFMAESSGVVHACTASRGRARARGRQDDCGQPPAFWSWQTRRGVAWPSATGLRRRCTCGRSFSVAEVALAQIG